MDSPDRSRSHARRGRDDFVDVTSDKVGDDEEGESGDKRKHRSSKSKKSSHGEEVEGLDGSGRRRSSGDRIESRKRSSGSSRADSDEDDYDVRKELRVKLAKKKQEESSLEKISTTYQDGEFEKGQDGGDKASKGHSRGDESERRKMASKLAEHESSRGSRSKEEKSRDDEVEKLADRDSSHLERRESTREKGHGPSESSRNSRRKWDESDAVKKVEDYERADLRSGKSYGSKYESGRERSASSRNEPSESRNRELDSSNDKSKKSSSRDERKADTERSKSKGRSEAFEEDNMSSPVNREERTLRDKNEMHRQQKPPPGRDLADNQERASNIDDNASTRMSDINAREVGHANRSRTPERSGRRRLETENSEIDYDRNADITEKEQEKEGQRDGRFKTKDDCWNDNKVRDREGSKESWKRRPPSDGDKESTGVESTYDRGGDWELPRHGRERNENERPHSRSGGRKDGNRGEAVKTSSKFGYSRENYDVIEIQPKPLDYGRAEPGSTFPRRNDVGQQSDVKLASNEEEWGYTREDSRDKYMEDGPSNRDPTSFSDEPDYGREKGRSKMAMSGRASGGLNSAGASQTHGNQDPGDFGRSPLHIVKGSRAGRGGRGRPTGRDNQQVAIPVPIMGSPFPHLGMPPPGQMQSLNPSMSPAPGPPIPPGVFIPPFSPPVVWPRGVDMNMMGIPPGLSPGPSGQRFPSNMSTPPNPGMYYNQMGPGRGPPNLSGSGFNALGPMGRGALPEKPPGGWALSRTGGPGRAPSRGEQNDYSQNFVDTGMRPQNFIRELELTNVVEDYPKLRELIQKKDEIVANAATPPMYFKSDLREFELSPEFFGTKFDVILIDPPWEEYVHRAPGVADHIEYWKFEEIMNLKIEAIADTPSFLFLWVGDGVGLEQGRQCLKKWGFRRCEDICWVKTNKNNATPGLIHDSHTILQHSKEHCLMGIKGTVRRSTDGHIIHANIDTDVIIAEEPPFGSTQKPEDMYRIIEHFALGKRRLELFGEDHNIRAGWLTVGKGLSSSNFNAEAYIRNFADKDGKVWQGGGGRNPPPDALHLVKTTPDIESLRPKSPIKNQQQMQQQQSAAISLTSGNSSNRRNAGNSPQKQGMHGLNQEASGSIGSTPNPWASAMEGFRGREGGNMLVGEMPFDMYGYSGQPNADFTNFDPHGPSNLM